MNVQEAVNAPRIHHQWLPDVLRIEEAGGDPGLVQALEAMGHEVSARGRQGTAHSIVVLPDGTMTGAPDPRDADAGAAGHWWPDARARRRTAGPLPAAREAQGGR